MKFTQLPSVGRLVVLLHYDPILGTFTWKVHRGRNAKRGAQAGTVCVRGYRNIRIDGVNYRASRIAFKMMTGIDPAEEIDHKNGHRSDDRWENLREASRSQNNMNVRRRKDNRTGYKGVFFHKPTGKYRAAIAEDGKQVQLGAFDDPEVAHNAYSQAALVRHGAFARLN